MVSAAATAWASGCISSRSVPILAPAIVNLPSKRVPYGISIPSANVETNFKSLVSASKVISPPRSRLSVRWVSSPRANNPNAPGSSAVSVVSFSLFKSPSIPVRMRRGSEGYCRTNFSSIRPMNLTTSGFPISAISRADIKPSPLKSKAFQSIAAFSSK